MQPSDSWGITAGILGIIIANMLLFSVTAFARRTGLQARWWSRSHAPERAHPRAPSQVDSWATFPPACR
jgi:hypothetical protein